MAKITRNMSLPNKALAAAKRLPQIARAVGVFSNWAPMTMIYGGGAQLSAGFQARGRAGFSIPTANANDVTTMWVVFCAREYHVPMDCNVVLDLGANIGAFSIFATKLRGARQVYAYEPVRSTFEMLQHNLELNDLGARVQAFNQGIGGSGGKRKIYLGVSSAHSSMIYRGNPTFESGASEDVEIVTLEQLFDDLQLDEVDMCKMDCEGGEVEAILAASDETLRRIKHLSMEYHYPANLSNDEEFFGRLARAGFQCTAKSRVGRLAQFVRV